MGYLPRWLRTSFKNQPMNPRVILIHPPLVKPSEPPAGIARLSSRLSLGGVEHQLIDANIEGLLYLMRRTVASPRDSGRWDVRAVKSLETNLKSLSRAATYQNKSFYSRAVSDINHVLSLAGKSCGVSLSLSDYINPGLSPVKSGDLFAAAETPEANPFYPYFWDCIRPAVEKSPEFIGFSLNFLSQALCTMAMIGMIKKINPRQKIILGGSLTTSWIRTTGRTDLFPGLVEKVIAGPGEEQLAALLGMENVKMHKSAVYAQLEKNPYLSPGFILPYSAAAGCWWRKCLFCPENAESSPYLPLPAEHVTEELKELAARSKPSLIHLLDSSISPALLAALADQPPGAPWYGFARVTEHLTDEYFCRALKESGCAMLKLGIESGDQEVLDRMNKGMNLKQAAEALRALQKAGIAVYCYFLFGTPPENEEKAMKTLDFVIRNAANISFMNLAVFNLPAASPEAQHLAAHDFYDGDLSLYKNFAHPAGWQRGSVRLFLENIFKKHPVVAPIVRRTPAFFTSNHAPFFSF